MLCGYPGRNLVGDQPLTGKNSQPAKYHLLESRELTALLPLKLSFTNAYNTNTKSLYSKSRWKQYRAVLTTKVDAL
jgi:hypothetical protein